MVMVGGPRERFERLPAAARSARHDGGVRRRERRGRAGAQAGESTAGGVHIAAAAEALGLAAALGLDPRAAWKSCGTARPGSFMLGDRGADARRRARGGRSALDIFVKDMGLVVGAAKARKLPTPLAAAAEQLYLAGSAEGLGRRDDSSLVTLYERWAGGASRTDEPAPHAFTPAKRALRDLQRAVDVGLTVLGRDVHLGADRQQDAVLHQLDAEAVGCIEVAPGDRPGVRDRCSRSAAGSTAPRRAPGAAARRFSRPPPARLGDGSRSHAGDRRRRASQARSGWRGGGRAEAGCGHRAAQDGVLVPAGDARVGERHDLAPPAAASA